jgi:hypothetical protein
MKVYAIIARTKGERRKENGKKDEESWGSRFKAMKGEKLRLSA